MEFGLDARNRLELAGDPSRAGALAALESFYFALNRRDVEALAAVWSAAPQAQLNNPLGGMLRGGADIVALYRRIFDGPGRLEITFGDVLEYGGDAHAVFAGRETGALVRPDGDRVALSIRTTRYFRYEAGRWWQFHHHGSIDDPDALRAYQQAVG